MIERSDKVPTHRDIEVFYDGDCPLCVREIDWLRRKDKHGRIEFTDIASERFDPRSTGVDQQTLMARIHGRLPDGSIVSGVEVFRRMYDAVGWKLPVAATRLPVVRQLLDVAYGVFARNRLRLTGRCSDGKCVVN